MFKKTFQARMKTLLNNTGLSATAAAKKAGISAASMNYYLNGSRCPDAQALYKLCTAFNVSSDWLLGFSDYSSVDTDLRSACQTLSISQNTANRIIQCNEVETLLSVDDDAWSNVCHLLKSYNNFLEFDHESEATEQYLEDGSVLLSGTKAAQYYAQMIGNRIAEGLAKLYNKSNAK